MLLHNKLCAAAIALVAMAAGGHAHAYMVTLDQFVVVKNGFDGVGANGVYLNDPFSDGNPLPSTEATLPNGTPSSVSTAGIWQEAGGRAIADSALGSNTPPTSVFSGLPITQHNFRFRTNNGDASNTGGLKIDDTIEVRGLFDLSSTLTFTGGYSIELRDSDSPGTNDDRARIGVWRGDAGAMSIRFRDMDASTGNVMELDEDTLLAGHNQILLVLRHEANSGQVTASYAYVDTAIDIADTDSAAYQSLVFTAMSGAASIFNGEEFTRAGVIVTENPVPAPGAIALFLPALAVLALARRRAR
jgi:hypothetical protein